MPALPSDHRLVSPPARWLAFKPSLALWLAAALLTLLAAAAGHQVAAQAAQARHAHLADRLANALLAERPAAGDLAPFLAAWAAQQHLASARIDDPQGRPLANLATGPAASRWVPAALIPALSGLKAPAARAVRIDGQTWHLRAAARLDDVLDASLLPTALGVAALLLMAGLGQGLLWQSRQRLDQAVAVSLQRLQAGADLQTEPGSDLPAARLLMPPSTPESRQLQALSDGLGLALQRQRRLMQAQGEQLEHLRTQACSDALTGLPNRRHFLATLDALLGGDAAPAASGLVLLRLRDLQGMNQRLGRSATDNVLQALGQALRSYPQRMESCLVGRLNGADFALWLPTGGLASETAHSLLQALRLPLCAIDAGTSVAAGVLELPSPLPAQQALALADAALARAESQGVFKMVAALDDSGDDNALPQGHGAWQRRIARALASGRVALGAFPVRTADGRQLHLDCPLRVALTAGGPLEPASRWLSQAIRSHLCAAVDEKSLQLALAATGLDGQARCINLAAQSVSDPEFIAAVTRRLEAQPDAACRLWLDLPEALALERPALVRELSRRWRPLGVMLALEHAGELLPRLPRLMDLGLDCVRIDSRFVNGLLGPDADPARRYLKGLVRLVQSVGLQASAEGVRSVDDLAVLWRLGFDSATGPALAEAPLLVHA